MTPERWQRVKRLFDAALEREGEARARFLSEAMEDDPSLASEVLGLLASNQQAGAFLSTPPLPPSLGESVAAAGPSLLGRYIGPYRVLAEIGHGGMGRCTGRSTTTTVLFRDTSPPETAGPGTAAPYASG